MPVTVQDVLAAPVLTDARVLGGASGLSEREVRWTTVIEWRGADFVRPGEFILTTGLGCDAQRFEWFARSLADSGAAALCVTLHEKGELREVPDAVRRLADERRFPVISVPWAIRFSEIMMSIIDRLIEQQYAAVLQEPDRLLGSFSSALLGGAGLTAIAEALAGMIQRPVLVLNSELYCVAESSQAREALRKPLDHWGDAIAALSEDDLREMRAAFGGESPRRLDGVEQLGLGPGLAAAAIARHRPVGYIYVPSSENDLPLIPTLERRAITHAAIAVAMEMLRLRAATEAESRVRGNFLWSLVAGIAGSPSEVATKAVLLGYDLRSEYEVAIGIGAGSDADSRSASAEDLAGQLDGAVPNAIVAPQSGQILFLLRTGRTRHAYELLETLMNGGSATWGVAEGTFALRDLHSGYRQAMQALEIGSIIHGEGRVTDARSVGPYLMLDVLSRDEPAVQSARSVLGPILEYDRGTSRHLLKTLEIYLHENGNTSAAARALFLNRHSLRYRLGKIEQLTGRSLEDYQDRFMLDISLKLLRLVEQRDSRVIAIPDDRPPGD
jgi:PucR family transcriptional regulator, purine catabolism regulatory protein